MSLQCLPPSFGSIGHTVWEMFEDFQNGCQGCHTGYWNEMILTILNVASMPPTKFHFNLTYGSRGDVSSIGRQLLMLFWRISRLPRWRPSWISAWNDFSNSESLYRPNAGSIRHSVREQMWSEDFEDGRRGSHLGYRNGTFLAILNSHVPLMLPIKFQLNQTNRLRRDVV